MPHLLCYIIARPSANVLRWPCQVIRDCVKYAHRDAVEDLEHWLKHACKQEWCTDALRSAVCAIPWEEYTKSRQTRRVAPIWRVRVHIASVTGPLVLHTAQLSCISDRGTSDCRHVAGHGRMARCHLRVSLHRGRRCDPRWSCGQRKGEPSVPQLPTRCVCCTHRSLPLAYSHVKPSSSSLLISTFQASEHILENLLLYPSLKTTLRWMLIKAPQLAQRTACHKNLIDSDLVQRTGLSSDALPCGIPTGLPAPDADVVQDSDSFPFQTKIQLRRPLPTVHIGQRPPEAWFADFMQASREMSRPVLLQGAGEAQEFSSEKLLQMMHAENVGTRYLVFDIPYADAFNRVKGKLIRAL